MEQPTVESKPQQVNVENDTTNITSQFSNILNTLSIFKTQITMLQNQMKSLEKTVKKKMKSLEKESKKNKMKGNRKPSGFAVPTKISDELCDFMKKPYGSEIARTEVTKYLIKYIKEKDLQWPKNRKIIKPNKALRSLLGTTTKDEVTYFNLQKWMNRHFVKK